MFSVTERVSRRAPIMLGKPDARVFTLTRQVAKEGFPDNHHDWLAQSYETLVERIEAVNTYGTLETSAIAAVLIDGIDDRVQAKAAERPPHGLMYGGRPAQLFPESGIQRADPVMFQQAYQSSFTEFEKALIVTYDEAMREQIRELLNQAQHDPVLASTFTRLQKIYSFIPFSEETISSSSFGFVGYEGLKKNLQSGVVEAVSFLRVLPFVCMRYETVSPHDMPQWQWYQQVTHNSLPFVIEYALSDTRIITFAGSRWMLFFPSMPGQLEEAAQFFQIVGEGSDASLDFSEEHKTRIHRLEAHMKLDPRRGCAGARVVKGKQSVVSAMWRRCVPIAGDLYRYFFEKEV